MAFVSIQGIGGGSGKDEEEKSVALDFSNGNQVVLPNSGATLSKVTVQKPALFVAENIRYGVTLGGVVGSYSGESEPAKPEETKTVALDLSLGNQTVEPTSGYVMTGVVITKPNTLKPENVKVGVNIAGVQGTYVGSGAAESDLDGIVDGTITTFAMPLGKTSVYKYSFYQMTSLASADLTGAITVGQYAFNGCTGLTTLTLSDALTSVADYAFDGCNQVTSISIPTTLTNIGQYAFRNVGGANCEAFSLTPDDECTVGQYAFNGSKITAVEGSFTTIGNYAFSGATKLAEVDIAKCANLGTYAFQNCTAVTTLKIKVDGSVGDYAFYGCTSVSECVLDADSVITALGSYAFSRFGGNRENPSENIIELDLHNSKFITVNQYAFGGDNATDANRNRYMNIRLPRTVTTVSAYAFRYVDNVNVYFATDRPPTFSAATAFSNATNYKIFVPYTAVNAYRRATNLTAFADNVVGYAAAGTFAVGEKLPEYNAEGYALTWYKDKSMTEAVTVVDDAKVGRFNIVGSGQSNNLIEFVEGVNLNGKTTFTMNDTNTNAGGFAESKMKTSHLPLIFDDLPDDLQEAIATVEVSTYDRNVSALHASECKLFLKSEYEVFGSQHYSSSLERVEQLKWYKEHNTNADRIRHIVDTTSGANQWLRSPSSSNDYYFCAVGNIGSWNYWLASNSLAVLPCFVIGKSA